MTKARYEIQKHLAAMVPSGEDGQAGMGLAVELYLRGGQTVAGALDSIVYDHTEAACVSLFCKKGNRWLLIDLDEIAGLSWPASPSGTTLARPEGMQGVAFPETSGMDT
jgi:hypothetical protein